MLLKKISFAFVTGFCAWVFVNDGHFLGQQGDPGLGMSIWQSVTVFHGSRQGNHTIWKRTI
jgi:hypothetical protein